MSTQTGQSAGQFAGQFGAGPAAPPAIAVQAGGVKPVTLPAAALATPPAPDAHESLPKWPIGSAATRSWPHPRNRAGLKKIAALLGVLALVQAFAWLAMQWGPSGSIPHYLPIHTLLETLSIVVSGMVFAVGWNSHRTASSPTTSLLACVFLCVALLDVAHMASYVGMPDYFSPNDSQKHLAFWLAARVVAALGLMVATLHVFAPPKKRAGGNLQLAAFLALAVGVQWLVILHPSWLPDTFVPGIGLTGFKKGIEYAVIAMNLVTAGALLARMRKPQLGGEILLLGAVCTLAMSDFFFTLYSTMTGTYNLLGHVYKVIGYGLIYRAIVVTAIEEPYRLLEKAKTKFSDIFDSVNDGIELISRDGLIVDFNRTAHDRLGYRREELVGTPFKNLCGREHAALFGQRTDLIGTFGSFTFESSRLRRDGSVIPVEVSARLVEVDDEELVLGISRDISERKHAERLLLKESAKNLAILRNSSDGIHILGTDGVLIEASDSFCAMLDYPREQLIGMHVHQWDASLSASQLARQLEQVFRENRRFLFETVHRRRGGNTFEVEISCMPLEIDGRPVLFNSSRDITARRETERQIESLAYYDPVTGLPNRRLMLDRLNQALAASARGGKNGALLLIDLDHFKTINDTLGHEAGDLLLRKVGACLTQCLRRGDSVARFGGDEFVVVLTDLHPIALEAATQMGAIAQKILDALHRDDLLPAHRHRNSASIGATLFDHRYSAEELVKQADIAMYQAKKAGRNAMRLFDPEMQESINERAALEIALRVALDEGQFLLHYQVQVDSRRHAIGVEALIRWQHPQKGVIPPGTFIPLAEETLLIVPMGQWVIDSACRQLALWRDDPVTRHLSISVNVSARQIEAPYFVMQIAETVRRHGIDPRLLVLEPTESLFLDNIEASIATLTAIKAIGVRCSLDDFGTGFSSLQYLKRLPLNQLKIDRSFVRDIVEDVNDQAIVRTIIAMAQSLGLEIIAEGVETEGQRDMLETFGCKNFQGYLFGRPAPVAVLEASLRAR
jgi:diguanylate cyclase (GGDEF)-like protein/PAS domain S-box-containing protein